MSFHYCIPYIIRYCWWRDCFRLKRIGHVGYYNRQVCEQHAFLLHTVYWFSNLLEAWWLSLCDGFLFCKSSGIFLSPHPKQLCNTGCPVDGHDAIISIHCGMQGGIPPCPLCVVTGVMIMQRGTSLSDINVCMLRKWGHNVAQLVEALRYKPEGRGFDSRWCHLNFPLTWSFWPHYGPGVDSASNRNEYREYLLGGKGDQCVWLTTLPPSSADCLEILGLQPPGTLRTCPGL